MPELETIPNAIVERDESGVRLIPQPRRVPEDVPLQALRIPAGWQVSYCSLYEIDPQPEHQHNLMYTLFFKEDILLLEHRQRNRILDVGWYPDGDLKEGQYGLRVYEEGFRGDLLHDFHTRDRHALVAEIERLLLAVSHGKL